MSSSCQLAVATPIFNLQDLYLVLELRVGPEVGERGAVADSQLNGGHSGLTVDWPLLLHALLRTILNWQSAHSILYNTSITLQFYSYTSIISAFGNRFDPVLALMLPQSIV